MTIRAIAAMALYLVFTSLLGYLLVQMNDVYPMTWSLAIVCLVFWVVIVGLAELGAWLLIKMGL